MAIIDWEAARRRDGYGPEPADAIPECDRNGSSPKALAAWNAMSDKEKLILLNNARCRDCHDANRGRMREMRLRHRPLQLLGAIPVHRVSAVRRR